MKKCALLFLAALSIAPAAQKVEMEDGVRIVHNKKDRGWGNNPKISVELVRTIGDVNTADENLAFNAPLDMAVDEAGNIYILDNGNQRVQKFSTEGKYICTFGRKGQGPGEFSRPSSIDLDGKGFLYVLDDGQKRIQVFTPSGEVHKTIPTIKLNLDRMRLLTSGWLITRGYSRYGISGVPKENVQTKLVKQLDPECNIRMEFGELFDFGDEITNGIGNSWQFAVDKQDHIYLSFLYQNRIEKYSPEGQLLWRADRELNYSTKLIEKGKQEVTQTSARFTAPKLNRVSAGIATDGKGRIWVVTYNRQIQEEEKVTTMVSGSAGGVETRKTQGNTDLQTTDMYKLEVFTSDGVLLGEIPLTQFVDMIYINKDRLFLLDRDRGVKFYEYNISDRPNSDLCIKENKPIPPGNGVSFIYLR